MKRTFRILGALLCMVLVSVCFSSCSDDEPDGAEHDYNLDGEWVDGWGKPWVHTYLYFNADDGTGIAGSYEDDIDWVNEEEEFKWYTVDDEWLYIDGKKYSYSCDGSSLTIYNYKKGRDYTFSSLD